MKKYYLIGEISKIFDIPKQTLRYYEQEGILKSYKNKDNGYRLYSIEDVIALTDIITYRSIGIPIKDIKKMFDTMNLDNIIDVISETEESIEAKIDYYTKMREEIRKRKKMYIEAKNNLGKFSIVNKSDIKYLSVIDLINADVLKKYLSDNYSYLIYIKEDLLKETDIIDEVQYGLSIEDIETIEKHDKNIIKINNKNNEYLTTVIAINCHTLKNKDLENIKKWIKENDKTICGSLVGKYLASSYEDSTIDYYKIWIPINNFD